MNRLLMVVSTECTKIIKSKIWILSIISILFIPLVCGLFMVIAMNPEVAQNSGLITQKARIITVANWQSYLSLVSQAISIGGIILFGFITSWTFGREYSDGTAKDLLALPLPRATIILAKFISIILWSGFLAIISFLLATIIGSIVAIPEFNIQIFTSHMVTYFIASFMAISLSTPIAYFACLGRGYLSPLGFLVFALFLGNILAAMGHGAYFPWSIPGIYAGIAGDAVLSLGSYLIVFFTGVLGMGLTLFWWRYVDWQ